MRAATELNISDNDTIRHTPMVQDYVNHIPGNTSTPLCPADQQLYQRIVGMAIYISHSRPDILYAISMLSSRSSAPNNDDLTALKRVINYLFFTIDMGITFRADSDFQLYGYADASFASPSENYRSHSGYTLHLGFGSAPIAAYSKRQVIVSLSTTESELEALRAETTLTIWVLGFLGDLGYSLTDPVIIYEDNKAAITILSTDFAGGAWARTRHFGIRYEFVKSHIESHTISLEYCPTTDMVADILTKPLERTQFNYLRSFLMGMVPYSEQQDPTTN